MRLRSVPISGRPRQGLSRPTSRGQAWGWSSVAISAIVFVLAIYATGSPTTNPLPLAQTTNALFWSVSVLASVAAGVGALFADRSAARSDERHGDAMPLVNTAWIVPVVSTAAAVLLVATFHNTTMIVAGPLIAFLGNAGSLLSRDLLDDADDSAQRTATTIQALVIHSVAFLALSAIYLNKLPTPVTALIAGVVSALLAVEALDRSPGDRSRKQMLAILAGSAVAAAVAPLMWWPTHGWTRGPCSSSSSIAPWAPSKRPSSAVISGFATPSSMDSSRWARFWSWRSRRDRVATGTRRFPRREILSTNSSCASTWRWRFSREWTSSESKRERRWRSSSPISSGRLRTRTE